MNTAYLIDTFFAIALDPILIVSMIIGAYVAKRNPQHRLKIVGGFGMGAVIGTELLLQSAQLIRTAAESGMHMVIGLLVVLVWVGIASMLNKPIDEKEIIGH
jgi:uncharacterized BrkB/YihY/UPF0761 family membrane protein